MDNSPLRLAIVVPVKKEDLNPLLIMVKSMEINPPSINFEMYFLVEEDAEKEKEFLETCDGITIIESQKINTSDFNNLVDSIKHKFILFIHPDVIFVQKNWCDMLIGGALQEQFYMMGMQPFDSYKLENGKTIQHIGDWMLLVSREHFVKCGGFPEGLDTIGASLILQLRMQKMGFPVAGAKMDVWISHFKRCHNDKNVLSENNRNNINTILEAEKLT